jgi:hypothetical protein
LRRRVQLINDDCAVGRGDEKRQVAVGAEAQGRARSEDDFASLQHKDSARDKGVQWWRMWASKWVGGWLMTYGGTWRWCAVTSGVERLGVWARALTETCDYGLRPVQIGGVPALFKWAGPG